MLRFTLVQDLVIGIVSAAMCIVAGVDPDILQVFVLCILAAIWAPAVRMIG